MSHDRESLPPVIRRGRRTDNVQQRGQVMILFALVLIVLLAFASLVIDLGLLRNDRQTLVNAIDSAALAGGTMMPVDGSTPGDAAAVTALVDQTMMANYPGLPPSAWTISYRCLVGVDNSSPPQPYISRDVPTVCDPSKSLGRAPVAGDFEGAGPTRFANCVPSAGDKCNVVVVAGNATQDFTFGRVVGVNSGNTGVVTSAACNGPCGAPPTVPVDLVVIIDRTASMSSADVQATRDAANSVLQIYDPSVQRVALGLLGPSSTSTGCGSPSTSVLTMSPGTLTAPTYGADTSAANASAGATVLGITRPSGTSNGSFLVAGISYQGGSGTTVTAPSGWTQIRTTNNGTNQGLITFYKVAGSSEPASYAFGLSPSRRASGGIIRFENVDTANPINADSGNTGSGTAVTASGVTTTSSATALTGYFATGTGTTFIPPLGMTEQLDIRNTNASGPSLEGATRTQAASGGTGNKQATAGASGQWAAQLIALTPKPVDTYGTNPATDLDKWVPIGLTGIGAPGYDEAYVDSNGALNPSSHIVSAIGCFDHPGGTGTNLATPMAMARQYLQTFGRPGVKWGIILETDGQPNYGGTGDPTNYTCAQASAEATAAKNAGIEVFTIGFGLDGANNVNCPDSSGTWSSKKVTNLLANMASQPSADDLCTATENSDGDHFFCQPKTSDLTAVFSVAAAQFAGIRTHLVRLYPIPFINGLSPSAGTYLGGTNVTISGRYFSGATSVTFGGGPVGFTVLSDSSILAVAPAGTQGKTVDVIVTTPGGSSPIVADDKYTYN